MAVESQEIIIGGVTVAVVRKAIRTMRLGVYAPDGQVRMSVPRRVSEHEIRAMVERKLPWIRRHATRLSSRPSPVRMEMVSGERHFFLGQAYSLNVVETAAAPGVLLQDGLVMTLFVWPQSTRQQRADVLQAWYRQQLKDLVPPLLDKWQAAMGVQVSAWGIKKMTTRWGTCNPRARRIWLNLELIKASPSCLEFIIVHELAHLIERLHNKRFHAIVESHLPAWREDKKELASVSLGLES